MGSRALGGSWAPDGCQDRSGSAPGQLLGRFWRLLGHSWRLFGPSWPCQEVPGIAGPAAELIFAVFLLTWHASGEAGNIDKS